MNVPQAVKNSLWSYDVSKMDEQKDKNLIIFNILNDGTKEAVDWLYQNYSKEDIKEVIKKSYKSSWAKKSLNYWSILLDVMPSKLTRFT